MNKATSCRFPGHEALRPGLGLVIGTAGHIDHGKTSLIRALTGMDTDRLGEEKRRGMSIDLGFARLDLGRCMAAVVDVPGHLRFIRNMLAGATGMDLVLFTVAADDGVMPQTVEHLDIIRLLGCRRLFFVITKTDLVGEDRILEVEAAVKRLAENTPFSSSPFFRVSTVTGSGIEALREAISREAPALERGPEGGGFFRLPVDRSFSIKGFGTVVTGTVASGSVKKGETVYTFPGGRKLRIRAAECMKTQVEEVSAGMRAALNVTGAGPGDITRGTVLVSGALAAFSGGYVVDCQFEILPSAGAIRDGFLYKLHHQTAESLARVRLADDRATGGSTVFGRLYIRRPLLMMKGDRFILRDPSKNITVGGGGVIVAYPERWMIPPLRRLRGEKSPPENLKEFLRWLMPAVLPGIEAELAALALNTEDLEALPEGFFRRGPYIFDTERLARVKDDVSEILKKFHAERPAEEGMGEEALAGALAGKFRVRRKREALLAMAREVLAYFVATGQVLKKGPLVALASRRPGRAEEESAALREVKKLLTGMDIKALRTEGLRVPGISEKELREALSFLVRSGRAVRLAPGAYISSAAFEVARKKVVEHIKRNGSIKAAELRDMLGCGRKLAIEILEYLDRERVTLRKGDLRILR